MLYETETTMRETGTMTVCERRLHANRQRIIHACASEASLVRVLSSSRVFRLANVIMADRLMTGKEGSRGSDLTDPQTQRIVPATKYPEEK